MSGFFCKSVGVARNCDTCKNNPMNQLGQAMRQVIKPTSRKGECTYYTQVLREAKKL